MPDLVERAVAGDVGCRRVIADAGRMIGHAAATLCNILDLRLIVVGGRLSRAGDVLLDALRDGLARTLVPAALRRTLVVGSALGEQAQVLSAVAASC